MRHHDTKAGEYVKGLTLEECATLLNVDVNDKDIMNSIYDTALAIKERIYGNRYAIHSIFGIYLDCHLLIDMGAIHLFGIIELYSLRHYIWPTIVSILAHTVLSVVPTRRLNAQC